MSFCPNKKRYSVTLSLKRYSVFIRRALLIGPFVLLSRISLAQDFVAMEIPDSVWLRMQGKTYVENPHITRSDLRYLRVLHWDYDNKTHRGELVCNRLIAETTTPAVSAIAMCPTRRSYPITPVGLPSTSTPVTIPMSVSVMVPKSCSQPMAVPMQIVHASSATKSRLATFATAFSFATASPGAAPGTPSKTTSTSSSNHNLLFNTRSPFPSSFLLPRSRLKPSLKAQPPGSGAKVQSPATFMCKRTAKSVVCDS